MKTITYDETIYKLVPIIADDDMVHTAAENGNLFRIDAMRAIEAAIAIVPDTLSGVVVHSGEPIYWLEAEESARKADPRDILGRHSMLYSSRTSPKEPTGSNPRWPLFTHPPAQPDTAQSIHYPECWDVVAYPTLESALSEIAAFKCSECQPDTEALKARIAELEADREMSADEMNAATDDLWAIAPNEKRVMIACPACAVVYHCQGGYKPEYTCAIDEDDL